MAREADVEIILTFKPGDRIAFEDMIHQATVKTNMFNGIPYPGIVMLHKMAN